MKSLIALLLASAAITSFAETVNIDFQSLEQENGNVNSQGFTYSEDGYTLDNLAVSKPFATFAHWNPATKVAQHCLMIHLAELHV